jgi:hypothetical protein
MLSLQEIFTKDLVKETIPDIRRAMDSSVDGGYYDHYEHNLYGTGIKQNPKKALNKSKAAQLKETLNALSLPRLMEFLASSGTTGISGAAYLIPDKVHQELFTSAVETDVCAQVSRAMLGPDAIPGSSVKIDIVVDESYKPYKFSSGGKMPEQEFETTQATLTPISWGINMNIGNDLIEDSQFDIIDLHIQEAGKEMGEFASNEALTILGTAPDGDGTLNSGTTGDADETKWDGATYDVTDAMLEICSDGYTPTILVTARATWLHSIQATMGDQYNEALANDRFLTAGWPTSAAGMSLIFTNCDYITNSKAFTNCKTLLADKDYGIVTGRKRWLRIENYSEPVMDLVGATVTARQDSVSLYKDAIATMTET